MAPEVFLHAQFSRAADVWSFGACLIEIITDKKPYHEYDHLNYPDVCYYLDIVPAYNLCNFVVFEKARRNGAS